jgi:hypothetical protein
VRTPSVGSPPEDTTDVSFCALDDSVCTFKGSSLQNADGN